MSNRTLGYVAALALLVGAPLHAQVVQRDSLLERLIGTWVLRGSMAGQNVVHDVTCAWVLGGEYVQMTEVSRERTPSGAPAYSALVYLVRDPHTHGYGILWMDNTDYNAFNAGGVGRATAVADSIPFVFVDSTGRFHNTFVYDRAADTWAWHMDNEDEKGRRPFARVVMTRAQASADSHSH